MPKGWISIFKPGTHTDAAGKTHTWTEEDVKSMADAYNNQPENERHDAPIVKGHPKTDDPAMGWVEKLKYEGGRLWAKAKDVNKDFANQVKEGAFKKISVRLYSDGKLLRHVGFLGATPPAIKGLGNAELAEFPQFNDDENESLKDEFTQNIEFEDVSAAKKAQQERATKYGVSINSSRGVVIKPEHYSELTDDDFADPVHYRFPIHDKANVIVSMGMFHRYDIRNDYSEEERQVVGSRIVDAAIKNGVEIDKYMFNEESNKSKFITNKEIKVDEKTKAFRDSFLAKLKDETNEDVATKAQKIFMEAYSESNPEKKKTSDGDDPGSKSKDDEPKSGETNFEESEAYQELKRSNQELQDKIRRNEFKEFLMSDEMLRKVPPSQRDNAMEMLEMAYASTMEFSGKDGAKVDGVEKVKQHLRALPDVIKLGEESSPIGVGSDNDFAEQDKDIEKYNKERGLE